jgi:membrane-associated phospholipid phosphatase
MAATVPLTRHRSPRWAPWRPSPRVVAAVCAGILLALCGDALVRDRGSFDYRLLDAVQRLDLPYLGTLLRAVSRLTSSPWAILAWVVALVGFAAVRSWSAAVALFFVPIGIGVNNLILSGLIFDRPRPSADHLRRLTDETSPTSFPSGHVVGAVLLYGLIFVAARRVERRPVRLALQGIAVVVIGLVGLARVWLGTHWVQDVVAGYAFGGLVLTGLLAACARIDAAIGDVPFVHAGIVPHDETKPHAHALTSTILFRGETVAKIYNPGFLPRAIYWLAFQAPFAYESNPNALRAAVLRRNLAGKLTEHWYGSSRVCRAVGIERIGGRYAVIGELVEGTEPRDHHAARAFLHDLADRFDETGLPTWQIDPRQPRSLGNIVQRPDGVYMVIDLESGLVSPLASPRAWVRAIRRGLVPFYDDVYFDLTRTYVEREAAAMRAAHGDTWLAELRADLDAAEAAAAAWHRSEPRIWSRFVCGVIAALDRRPGLRPEASW